MDISGYTSFIASAITNQVAPYSISPAIIGQGYTDLANNTKTNIESVNAVVTGHTLSIGSLSATTITNTGNIASLSGITTTNSTNLSNVSSQITGYTASITGLTTNKEDKTNKATSFAAPDNTKYPTLLTVADSIRQSKSYNYFYQANYNTGILTSGNTCDTPTLVAAPGILPFKFISNAIKITGVLSSGGSNSFCYKTFTPAVTDRFVYGGWFYKGNISQTGGVSTGFYNQTKQGGSTTQNSIQWTTPEIVLGATKSRNMISATITAISGDWFYIEEKNTADLQSGTTSMVINLYTGAAASNTVNSYYANLTYLLGESSLNPYTYYDNSAFGVDSGLLNGKSDINTIIASITGGTASLVNTKLNNEKTYNALNDGNNSIGYWGFPSTGGITDSFVDAPGVLPYPFVKQALKIDATSGKTAYVIKDIPCVPTDRIVVGGWFRKTAFTSPGISAFGFYLQYKNSAGAGTNISGGLVNAGSTVQGGTYVNGIMTTKIDMISGDWAYISVRNTADFPSTIVSFTVNPYADGSALAAPYSVYWNNFSYVNSKNTINSTTGYQNDLDPLINYDNSAYTYLTQATATSPIFNKKLAIGGDSIMNQGFVPADIVSRTGAILTNAAISGSAYGVNGNTSGTILSQLSGITASTPDVVFIAAGTNDYGRATPMGSFTSRSATTEFYSSVYNTFLALRTALPTTPVLIGIPSQRYYQTAPWAEGTNRPNVNSLGLSLQDYNAALKSMCDLFSFPYVDLYSKAQITYENISTLTVDGLHPSAIGVQYWGKPITKALNNLFTY